MSQPTAQSILSSRHTLDYSKRVDTLLLKMPRCILSEFNTHRMFSRNAASSRAIPVERMLAQIENAPFIPLWWGKSQAGMQAFDEHEDPASCEKEWLLARDKAVASARQLARMGLHKQIVNRIVEPWMWTKVVVTSTNWSNFLALRDHKDAEPHIQILAQEVRKALEGAEVQVLLPGQWHMPFVTHAEWKHEPGQENAAKALDKAKKLSVARCASTSYRTTDGFEMTLDRAEAIYEKLLSSPMHASPFEHIAQMDMGRKVGHPDDFYLLWDHPELGGNLGPGFVQLRKTFPHECA